MSKLLFLCGSLRAASASRAMTRTLVAALDGKATCTTADIGALPHYNADVTDDPAVAALVSALEDAGGVVFVTPEYNYSLPGVLKNAIDWASRPAYASVFKDKPCFVITLSGGALGGVRAQAHLKYILNGMLARVHVGKEILVPMANTKVGEDGLMHDADVLAFTMAELEVFIAGLPS